MTLTHHEAQRRTRGHHAYPRPAGLIGPPVDGRPGSVTPPRRQTALPASDTTLTPATSAAQGAAWIGGGLIGAALTWASVTAAWDATGATRELSWSLIALLAAAFTACALHVGLMHLLAAAATLAGPTTGLGRALIAILRILSPRLARAVIVASSTASCAIALMAPPAGATTIGADTMSTAQAPVAVQVLAAHGGMAHGDNGAGPAAGSTVTDPDREPETGHTLPALGWAADTPAASPAPMTPAPTTGSAPDSSVHGGAVQGDDTTSAPSAADGGANAHGTEPTSTEAAGTENTDTGTGTGAATDVATGRSSAEAPTSTATPGGTTHSSTAPGSAASTTHAAPASDAATGQDSADQAQAPASPDAGAHEGANVEADADGADMQVRPGDSLWAIARNQLPVDHPTNEQILDVLDRLIEANPQIENPDLIFPGQGIKLPSLDVPR